MTLLYTLLLSTYTTILLIPGISKLSVKINAIDMPMDRKIHMKPVPRTGGIAMALGTLIPMMIWASDSELLRATLLSSAIITIFGILDDLKGIGPHTKLFGQSIAAMIFIFYSGVKITYLGDLLPKGMLLPDWASIPLTLLFIVGATNAINLADGLDGLAGGITLVTFVCIAFLAFCGNNTSVTLLSMAISGAIFGFLRFNTFPATLFMGDTGSQLLGFLASTLSMTLTQGNTPLSPLLPLALLGFPILDTLTVMLARMAAGHSPFRADKNHFHHKLLRLGLYHSEAVITIYSLQFFLVACAYIFRSYSEFFLILFYGLFSGTILFGFFLAHKTRWRLKRYDLFDKVIKGRLRVLKEKNILIKFSFRFVEVMAPSLLLFTAVLPSNIPRHFGLLSITLLLIIILVWGTNHKWRHNALAIALYLFIPYLLYISETHQVTWMNKDILFVYNMSFGVLIFFTYLTLKFTRRRNGFKSTPMDFLILFMVLIIPNLPDGRIQSYRIGMLAMKTIVFFLSYEVIIGELRVQSKRLGLSTMAVLIVMGLRGILG